VWSRPVTGLPLTPKWRIYGGVLDETYLSFRWKVQFRGARRSLVPKRGSKAGLLQLTERGSRWTAPSLTIASAELPKIRGFSGPFQTFRGKVQFEGPGTHRSRKGDPMPWTSRTYRAGEQCGAARHWTPGEREMPKIEGISIRLSKLSEGMCEGGTGVTIGPEKEIRSLDFSNLQSGRAVWSRPVTGLP
jgi:hypothetical protein